jgi:hypothetical protein
VRTLDARYWGTTSEWRTPRNIFLAVCLVACAVAIPGASLAASTQREPDPASAALVRHVAPTPSTEPLAVTSTQPLVTSSNPWTDYVLVDAVVDAHTLMVHSTREEGHPKYAIVTDENTILNPPDGLFGPAPGIRAGSWFYFTGVMEAGTAAAPTSVRALRLFQFSSPAGGLAPPGVS